MTKYYHRCDCSFRSTANRVMQEASHKMSHNCIIVEHASQTFRQVLPWTILSTRYPTNKLKKLQPTRQERAQFRYKGNGRKKKWGGERTLEWNGRKRHVHVSCTLCRSRTDVKINKMPDGWHTLSWPLADAFSREFDSRQTLTFHLTESFIGGCIWLC